MLQRRGPQLPALHSRVGSPCHILAGVMQGRGVEPLQPARPAPVRVRRRPFRPQRAPYEVCCVASRHSVVRCCQLSDLLGCVAHGVAMLCLLHMLRCPQQPGVDAAVVAGRRPAVGSGGGGVARSRQLRLRQGGAAQVQWLL